MRQLVNTVCLILQSYNQMLVASDLIAFTMKSMKQSAIVVPGIQGDFENFNTPPPRFLPIERWISAVNPAQPPNDFTQFPVLGAGILDFLPID